MPEENKTNDQQAIKNDSQKKVVENVFSPGEYIIDGKYKILEKIGSGGMATVYSAIDSDGRKYAVKVNTRKLDNDERRENHIANFTNEINNIARLNSCENIVNIINYDVHQKNRLIIVLEYIDGGTLLDRINKFTVFSPSEIRYYFLQIINALIHAHSNGIIHRDIKAENVFLTNYGVAKLGDFGISFTEGDIKQSQRITGTPRYMPPEIYQGNPATKKSDIYSLGVLMYICIVGIAPFISYKKDVEAQKEVFNSHVNERPVPPIEINTKIPIKLNNIILKMLEKKPEDRPETMNEIYEVLSDSYLYEDDKVYQYKGRPIDLEEFIYGAKSIEQTTKIKSRHNKKRITSAIDAIPLHLKSKTIYTIFITLVCCVLLLIASILYLLK